MEQYLNNTKLPYLQKLSSILGKPLTFIDLEATGLVHDPNFAIIEIGLIIISPTEIVEKSALVDPEMSIPFYITEITGIDDSMVKGKKTFSHFNQFFQKISQSHILCGYNSKSYDSSGVRKMSRKNNTYYSFDDQLDVRYLFLRNRNILIGGKSQKGSLTDASNFYKVQLNSGTAHRAAYDIALTALLAEKILETHGFESILIDVEKLNCHIAKNNFKQYLQTLNNI